MFVTTRSGKKETVKFDKITLRISKLTYGLNTSFIDAMEVAKKTIQGLFEMIGLRYVGSGVLASAVSMDKSYAKPIFAAAGLKVAPGTVVTSTNFELPSTLKYPLFVKPARSGSSRGTTKVKQSSDLKVAVEKLMDAQKIFADDPENFVTYFFVVNQC